jgi:peptidoglycan hydrolase CwlO-like protein
VKLTHALVRDLDEVIKEVKLLREHEEESSQKITKLEALCKKLREDTQRLEEDKATLEGMVESRDELLMEIARETRLDRMGEDDEDEEEEEDADNGEDAAAPPAAAPPPPAPLLPHLRRSMMKALWRPLSKKPQCCMRLSW